MTIKNGSAADSTDIEKNIITYLEGINQITILSQDASLTDKTYTLAESDHFNDSTGYNNHVDTGNSTARFLGDRYVLGPGTIYDNFDDDSYDTNLWTKTETVTGSGVATVTETGQHLEIHGESVGTTGTGLAISTTDTNFSDYLRWTVDTLTHTGAAEAITRVKVNNVIITDKSRTGGQTTYNDYATGTWELIKVGTDSYKLYKNQALIRTIAVDLAGAVAFEAYGEGDGADVAVADHEINDVYLTFASSSYVQTNSKTFAANISSGLINANKDISLSGTSVDVDISTDGGSVFDVSDQALDTIHALDDDNTSFVIRINLKKSGTGTPWVFGYAYQGWT